MMDRNFEQSLRLQVGGYMQPNRRPHCGNCAASQLGPYHRASHCTLHDAPVAAQGLCGRHSPAPSANIGPLRASRKGCGKVDPHTNLALQLAALDDGATNANFATAAGVTPQVAATKLKRFVIKAMLWPAKVPPEPTHWFLTAERAAAWQARQASAAAGQPAISRKVPARKFAKYAPAMPKSLAAGGQPAPVTGVTTFAVLKGEPSNPNNVQPIYGRHYTHDIRIQCAPGERPFGAGFAAVRPGVNPMTGQAWEQRA